MTKPRCLALVPVVALSAVLNTVRLSQNGYANIFYSAGVKSMLRSLHNFLFVSFDPGGLVTVDKPPLALWVQGASAKLFGFSPLSLMLPEAIAGVLTVALMYLMLERRFGTLAAFTGALAMAVFPSFVAVSRENGVDSVLILLLVLACGAAVRACETGRLRTLLWSGVLVGLAFNTKTLAAYLVVPGIALAYVVCAPVSLRRRATQVAVAGLAMLVVSFSWIALVELTPASKRPYVGSSTNNTELGLTFEYNGFGRVEGQSGGPNSVVVKPGAYVPASHQRAVNEAAARAGANTKAPQTGTGTKVEQGEVLGRAVDVARVPKPTLTPITTTGREVNPIPFGGAPSPVRLFGVGLGDQAGWMLPFALFGALAVALLALLDPRPAGPDEATAAETPYKRLDRRDPRIATALVLGGWFVVEAVVLSLSKGIVHPYYVSALAPGTGAMAGAGVAAFTTLARGNRRILGLALMACAIVATVAIQIVLLHREHYMQWFVPVLPIGAAAGVCALVALRRLAAPALTATFLLLLVAPTAYSATTWLAPAEGTFPAAGPKHHAGDGAYGISTRSQEIYGALAAYVSTHGAGSRWALLTVASDTAAPMILFGLDAGALGGYSGSDPALDGPSLARLVAERKARYVLLGGEYSTRGGNGATRGVLRACRELTPSEWASPVSYPLGLVLFDCAGHERALAAG
jgi:4-amino-4-deoxy-L-arabinose transferase-like glycosyltransferase